MRLEGAPNATGGRRRTLVVSNKRNKQESPGESSMGVSKKVRTTVVNSSLIL